MRDTLGILFVVALLLLAPLVAISSVNILLDEANLATQIPHNLWTYIAAYGFMLGFGGGAGIEINRGK